MPAPGAWHAWHAAVVTSFLVTVIALPFGTKSKVAFENGAVRVGLDVNEASGRPLTWTAALRPPPPVAPHRERPYSTRRTFWCFLWQMLNQNTSCREVVQQLQSVMALHGVHNLDSGNSGYCQARARLPVYLLEQGLRDTAAAAERSAPQTRGLQGRPLKAADGSTVVLADTPKNQRKYPQQKSQKRGCGFPILRLSVVFSLHSGAVLQVAKGSYYQHELRLFHTLHNQLQAGDILVYDRAGGHYVLAAQLRQQNVDLISRVLIRPVDCRCGKRLGKRDRLVVWKKGPQKPAYLTPEEWAALPEEITVRSSVSPHF
jgi:hypothetical protein